MIAKAPDQKTSEDRFLSAGIEAERQMHFYLERAFGRADDVVVFGDLRLVDGNRVCQIDHLVMHRYGLAIVESKSVSGGVEVNEHEEWVRRFGGRVQGMPSPILQAGRQRDFLIPLLQEHRTKLRNRLLGLRQKGFLHCPVDIFVAISDHGRIKRRGVDPPELKKADQIPQAIQAIIERHRKGSSLLRGSARSNDGMWELNAEEMTRVRTFLLVRHQPRSGTSAVPVVQALAGPLKEMVNTLAQSPPPAAAARDGASASPSSKPAPPPSTALPACAHCASTDLRMVYGGGPRSTSEVWTARSGSKR